MYVPLNRRVCLLLLWLWKRVKILPFHLWKWGSYIYLLDSTAKGWFITGRPVAEPIIISVFGCLCRKMNTQGRDDTRSEIKKWFSHNLFPNNPWSFSIELRCEIMFPSLLFHYCGSKFMSFCLEQIQDLKGSATHPNGKFKGVATGPQPCGCPLLTFPLTHNFFSYFIFKVFSLKSPIGEFYSSFMFSSSLPCYRSVWALFHCYHFEKFVFSTWAAHPHSNFKYEPPPPPPGLSLTKQTTYLRIFELCS